MSASPRIPRWRRQQAGRSNSLQILPSNLLYPKEDRATNQLMFTCRTCHVGEPASSYCVYQNKLNSQVGDTAGVTQDVGSDPTVCVSEFLCVANFCLLCGESFLCALPRANKLCPSCGENEAVFFQSQQRSAETGMVSDSGIDFSLHFIIC
ncbi:hypothetical protein N7454_005928 [Penicillium verhagenii]|nr:hypothetical protein N7454_005928 [Penicillium verhagenii]